jgi:hypothetical protein
MGGSGEDRAISRAALLKLGAAAALTAGTAGAGRALAGDGNTEAASALGRPVPGPRYLRRSSYTPLVGTSFRVQRPGGRRVVLYLASVTALESEAESFSLIFRSREGSRLPQDTYRIEHPRLGTFPLFLVPVGAQRADQEIQAIVNRIPASDTPGT